MIPAVIISPDAELAEQLEASLAGIGQIAVLRKLYVYPLEYDLARLIRALAPQIFFLNVAVLDEAVRVVHDIETHAPGTQILAIGHECDQRTLLELMRAGVREFVPLPFRQPDLSGALLRLNTALERMPPAIESSDLVFSFLPAKPGVGCSTVALNTAVALAAIPGQKVLLADFDLNCGVIGFLLHLDGSRSILDAAEHAPDMDEEIWSRLVRRCGELDVLPAGRMQPGFRIEGAHIHYLLEFARRNYQVICADLSGLMEKYSLELMQESKRIYLVCTPELPALYLAREKLQYLHSLELQDRAALLLNRAQKRALVSAAEVEKMLGVRIAMELPNDYAGVHKAFNEARPVAPRSELGKRFAELARRILAQSPQPEPGRCFVDYFSLVPNRYTFAPTSKKSVR